MNATLVFTIFLVLNLVGTVVNHIDDTDETYGYWEPLHYLSHQVGLQTWEYAPQYAIRTYSFIFPAYAIAKVLQSVDVPKLLVFKTIKGLLGLLAACAGADFVTTISELFGQPLAYLTMIFMLLSPGIFFCSTSYLPSAVCMSLLMLSVTAWLKNKFTLCIFWGSVAVLCTGWPFVGLLFLPLGLHMVISLFVERIDTRAGKYLGGVLPVVQLAAAGVALIAVIQALVFALDFLYYNKWTSPTLNILLYNAIGGSGDELYGIEPASYYIKNLFLNLGLAWVLVLVSPLAVLVGAFLGATNRPFFTQTVVRGIVIYTQAAVWLLVLFSRPHKEERFLYPIYPLLAFIGACTLQQLLNIIVPPLQPARVATTAPPTASHSVPLAPKQAQYNSAGGLFRAAVVGLCVALSAGLFVARVASNYTNYGGYMRLWESAGRHIDAKHTSKMGNKAPINVCTGSEWYQFPSHFHLPSYASLQFISDGFGGILPQHFSEINGTFAEPPQAFNDRNTEVRERYISLQQCDYLVVLLDRNKEVEESILRSQLSVAEEVGSSTSVIVRDERTHKSGPRMYFRMVAKEPVVSPEFSASALFRAYFVPFKSPSSVKFKDYVLFERE